MDSNEKYTKENIIEVIKEFYNTNGKIVSRDLKNKDNKLPSPYIVDKFFGSFKNCLKEAGIPLNDKGNVFDRQILSDNELLKRFKKTVEKYIANNNCLPSLVEICKEKEMPSSSTYLRRFKSIDNIFELIGINKETTRKELLEKDMLEKYVKACKEVGHVLNSREIDKLSKQDKQKIYSASAYIDHFKNISNLQVICNLNKTMPGRSDTNEDYLNKLIKLSEILGRRPVKTDLILYEWIPSASSYESRFGSFTNALKEAGLEHNKIYKNKDGKIFNSSYELAFANTLDKYNINYENEVPYKDIISNFDRNFRFDFVITYDQKNYYIELFCIVGNESYDKRKIEKIEICKENKLPLIELYQEDIYGKNYNQIYSNLLNNISVIKEKDADEAFT